MTPEVASLDPEHRRSFVKEHFQKHGIWNDTEWDSLLIKTEEKLCQLLATVKYVKVSQAYFKFESEKLAWGKHVRACGLNADEHRWPWADSPNPLRWKDGISAKYVDWRLARGLPLIELKESKTAATATTQSTSSNA
ncbi:Ff.00g079280.m01.CDS01 [Fusarium sp. VM40]|nr:Ff.00g079280.m01.CDS01 [Fusarium sp. VM40]